MNWKIPLFDPDFGPAELEAVQQPLREGWLTMGPRTEQLEQQLCERTGAAHAIAVANCTAALHLSLLATGIGPGDEVLCPTLTFVATANAIRYVGAAPVLCESVGPRNLNVDPDDLAARVTSRTKAIMTVHYAGFPADMARIASIARRHDLLVVEDCAHALFSTLAGRVCGTWGDLGCFSFFSNKNLTCGEGGAIITNNGELAARLKRLRSHGMTTLTLDRHKGRAYSYDVVDLGFNYRMDEIRANLTLAQLGRLDGFLARRRELTAAYCKRLCDSAIETPDFDWPRISQPGDRVGHHIMPVLLPEGCNRTAVIDCLRELGIQSSIHYPPIHRFQSFGGQPALPRTEALAARQLTLPLFPTMTLEQVAAVCDGLEQALERLAAGATR